MDKKRIWWIALLVTMIFAIISGIAIMAYIYNDNERREASLLSEIKESAILELGIQKETEAEIKFTGHWEEFDSIECNVYLYTLKIGDSVYVLGAKRKGWDLLDVEIIGEIKNER